MNSMEYARRAWIDGLYRPRRYRAGKFTRYGGPKTQRETILELEGPGVLKRIWTTHAHGERVRIHLYIDGEAQPVLSGFAHELAAAAEQVVCEAIPLGGFYDHRSANLYLPIPFKESLRLDAEPEGDPGDGPYWQIDYALDCEETFPLPRQRTDPGGKPVIEYDEIPAVAEPPARDSAIVDEDIELRSASPHDIWIEGGGVIREIAISGKALDSLLLRIAFDGERGEDDRLDGPFQVDAPLRYLVGPFSNAGVERSGSTAVIHFPMPFRVRAGIQLLTGMDYGAFREAYNFNVRVKYEKEAPPSDEMACFHAQFRSAVTNGRDDFECCATRGRGHFVGVHIFDTGHDHGGGDNILFDAGADTAGQLHGICGEDYFHMAYMRIWNRTPYSGCPAHSSRYRYHLEMPIPFAESFTFNWGSFASQPAKAVAFWYQDAPSAAAETRDLTYTITGSFHLDHIDRLAPETPLPETAAVWPAANIERPTQSWRKRAQNGFIDLCHMHRKYVLPVPPSGGSIPGNTCTVAETKVWAARDANTLFRLGCDDAVRLYVNGDLEISDDGRNAPDPFQVMKQTVTLRAGLNSLRVVVANTPNHNWHWHGFSLALENDLAEDEMLCLA